MGRVVSPVAEEVIMDTSVAPSFTVVKSLVQTTGHDAIAEKTNTPSPTTSGAAPALLAPQTLHFLGRALSYAPLVTQTSVFPTDASAPACQPRPGCSQPALASTSQSSPHFSDWAVMGPTTRALPRNVPSETVLCSVIDSPPLISPSAQPVPFKPGAEAPSREATQPPRAPQPTANSQATQTDPGLCAALSAADTALIANHLEDIPQGPLLAALDRMYASQPLTGPWQSPLTAFTMEVTKASYAEMITNPAEPAADPAAVRPPDAPEPPVSGVTRAVQSFLQPRTTLGARAVLQSAHQGLPAGPAGAARKLTQGRSARGAALKGSASSLELFPPATDSGSKLQAAQVSRRDNGAVAALDAKIMSEDVDGCGGDEPQVDAAADARLELRTSASLSSSSALGSHGVGKDAWHGSVPGAADDSDANGVHAPSAATADDAAADVPASATNGTAPTHARPAAPAKARRGRGRRNNRAKKPPSDAQHAASPAPEPSRPPAKRPREDAPVPLTRQPSSGDSKRSESPARSIGGAAADDAAPVLGKRVRKVTEKAAAAAEAALEERERKHPLKRTASASADAPPAKKVAADSARSGSPETQPDDSDDTLSEDVQAAEALLALDPLCTGGEVSSPPPRPQPVRTQGTTRGGRVRNKPPGPKARDNVARVASTLAKSQFAALEGAAKAAPPAADGLVGAVKSQLVPEHFMACRPLTPQEDARGSVPGQQPALAPPLEPLVGVPPMPTQSPAQLLSMFASIGGPLASSVLAFNPEADSKPAGLASSAAAAPPPAAGAAAGAAQPSMKRSSSAGEKPPPEAMAGGTVYSKEQLQAHYHLPINEAAEHLGIGVTLLKKVCRVYGIDRWPQRKLSSLDKLIQPLEEFLKTNEGDIESVKTLERLRTLRGHIFHNPNSDLDEFAKKLRQATLKAQHMLRVSDRKSSMQHAASVAGACPRTSGAGSAADAAADSAAGAAAPAAAAAAAADAAPEAADAAASVAAEQAGPSAV